MMLEPLTPKLYGSPRVAPNGKQVVFSSNDSNAVVVLIHELSGNHRGRNPKLAKLLLRYRIFKNGPQAVELATRNPT